MSLSIINFNCNCKADQVSTVNNHAVYIMSM